MYIYCGRRRNKRYDSTSLLLNTQQLIYKDCTRVPEYTQLVWPSTRGVARSPQGSSELWCQLAGEEVRGLISEAVTAGGAGTAAVETGMAPQVQGMQKTGPQPEKRFLDRHLTVPEER